MGNTRSQPPTRQPPAPAPPGPPPKPTPRAAEVEPTVLQRDWRHGPTREQIARRAYEIFLARGCQHGHAEEDWALAERELWLGRR